MPSLAEKLQNQTKAYADKMARIDFQVDTLSQTSSRAGGYFSPGSGTITLNYHEDDASMQRWEQESRETILYHEQKHRTNKNKGFKSYDINVSPEQYYHLCNADEVSANMAELIYLREKYIQTRNIDVFDEDDKKFSFYKEAVQKGEINPLSNNSEDFEKDMALIANGTQKMWKDTFNEQYSKNHISMTKYYLERHKGSIEPNDKEYQKQLDIAYTLGGVNFKKYLKEDIALPEDARFEVSELERLHNAHNSRNKFKTFQENMSIEQYNNLLQHIYIAEKIEEGTWFSQEDIAALDKQDQAKYKQLVQSKYQNALKELAETKGNNDIVWRVNNVVGNKGERATIPSANDQNYQQALKEIYNIRGVDYTQLLNINSQEKMPIEKSKYVQDFENRNVILRYGEKLGKFEVDAFNWVKNGCVKGWNKVFNSKKKTVKVPAEQESHLKNYRQWSKDHRVSEIQYVEILDLEKNVISRPNKTVKSEQKQTITPVKTTEETKKKQVVTQGKTETSNFKISMKQITESYGSEHLKSLCTAPQRWNAGRQCDAEKYSHAASITGVPAEVIAYAYEVNRKNFPKQAAEADKVKNGSKLSDLEIAKSVAGTLAKYDIERNSFFALREQPKQITLTTDINETIKNLRERRSSHRPQLWKMRGQTTGMDLLYIRKKQYTA